MQNVSNTSYSFTITEYITVLQLQLHGRILTTADSQCVWFLQAAIRRRVICYIHVADICSKSPLRHSKQQNVLSGLIS